MKNMISSKISYSVIILATALGVSSSIMAYSYCPAKIICDINGSAGNTVNCSQSLPSWSFGSTSMQGVTYPPTIDAYFTGAQSIPENPYHAVTCSYYWVSEDKTISYVVDAGTATLTAPLPIVAKWYFLDVINNVNAYNCGNSFPTPGHPVPSFDPINCPLVTPS